MIAAITSAFAEQLRAKPCLTSQPAAVFIVHDPPSPNPNPCLVVDTARAVSDLFVHNPRGRVVHLLAIDKCLYAYGGPETRCDCALIIEGSIHFVEFKTHSSTHFGGAADSLDQLAASIDDFYDRHIIPQGALVHAIASIGYTRALPYNGARLRELQLILSGKVKTKAIRLRLKVDSELQAS